MTEWWRFLRGKPFFWALDGTHPAADLAMLRDVIERPTEARPLKAAQLALKESPPVQAALALLDEPSLWTRYEGIAWRLRWLAELGVPGDDERIATALARLLDAPPPDEVPAAAALLVQMAAAFGFSEDERVQQVVATLSKDDESVPPQQILDLEALAALPTPPQNAVRARADKLSSLAPHDLEGASRFGLPTYDQPDALTLALAAVTLGIREPWVGEWVRLVEEAQDEQGLWRLEEARPTPGIPPFTDEAEGAPSRLISARALYVLRAWHGE